EIAGHEVDVVRKVLPGAGDTGHLRLTAKLAFGADLAGHARHFGSKRIQLIDHRVDGVLQLENFAAHVDRDLAGEVAARDSRGHFGDVAHLGRQVARHGVHVVGEVLPRAGDAWHLRLAAEPPLRSDFARHARHLAGEAVELIDHRVQRFLELQDFAAHVDGDLAGQVAVGDRRGDFRDVAYLGRQVSGHRVDAVGEVFPGAGDAGDDRLAAELAVGADLARHARDFGRKGIQLVDHRVDGLLELKNLAADVHG